MGTIDGGEVLVRCLAAEGVDSIFAISDITYATVFRSAREHGLSIVGGRHESANVHMADAWARATGEMAVAMAGMGPGVANLVPGVINAHIEGIPLLVVATQRTHRAHQSIRRGRFQYTPQIDVFDPVTGFAGAVPDAARIDEYVREAFRSAWNGRPGPVYVEIADELLRAEVDEAAVDVLEPARYRSAPGTPDPDDIDRAADLLVGADLPLVLAGSGVEWAEAWEELERFVESAGALVMTTMGSRGLVDEDHPQLVMFNSDGGERAAQQADVVLAVGTQVGEMLRYGSPPHWAEDQRWIHLDCDPDSIGVNRPVDVALVGDAGKGIEGLHEAIRERDATGSLPEEGERCVEACRSMRSEVRGAYGTGEGEPIHPGDLADTVAEFVPGDAIVCFDGGNTALWAHVYFTLHRPRSLMWTSHFGHLGTGLPYAVGAGLAHPDRPVFLFSGDSAFAFNLQELETAARENVDLVAVINCDYAWGMEHLGMEVQIGETIGVETSEVRFDRVAEGLGCHGELVDEPGEIRPALERAFEADGPAVVQVLINPDENIQPPGLLEFADMYAAEET